MNRRLTDNYNKDDGSVISRLLLLLQEPFEAIPFEQVRLWRGVDKAEGSTLDLIGGNVNQQRGQVNDTVFRSLIRSRILRNKSNGTINDLIELLAFALQIEPEEIELKEGYELAGELNKPAFLYLMGIPSQNLADIGLSTSQLRQILNEAAAGGVRVEVQFIFNTWGTVSQYTWGDLQGLTWQQVLEEELSGSILPD